MRKLLIIVTVLLFLLSTSCGAQKVPQDDKNANHTTEQDDGDKAQTTVASEDSGSHPVIQYYEFDPIVGEIELPADGETVKYETEVTLFESDDGRVLRAVEAYRDGKDIYFLALKGDNLFYGINMSFLTKDGDVFIALNADTEKPTADERYVYYKTSKFESAIDTTTVGIWLDIFHETLGDSFDENKSYYYVSDDLMSSVPIQNET